jgi:phage terminase large subunit
LNQFKILPAYSPLFWSDKPYYLISGGRASGKSTNCAAFLIIKLFEEEYNRIVVARYTQKSIKSSIYQDILDLLDQWKLKPFVEITGDTITHKVTGNQIITHAFKLSDGTQVAKGKGIANPNILFIDEFTEIDNEQEWIKLVDSFRKKGSERKIIMAFNPTSKASWIFQKFYLPDGSPNPDLLKRTEYIHTTYVDNAENLDPTKIAEWEETRLTDPHYFNHHILGHWADIGEGQIFTDWTFTTEGASDDAETLYGMDFGFAQDPTTLIEVKKKGTKIWLKELIYQTGLTNEDIVKKLQLLGLDKKSVIFADSAEPKSIETLRRAGFLNVRPAVKGPDSVRFGIDKIKSYTIFADARSKNLLTEYNNYSWRTGTDQPIDKWNHLMDAIRYALSQEKAANIRLMTMSPQWNSIHKNTRHSLDFDESEFYT